MIWLYRLLFLPALLVVLPLFLWRTRKRGDWRRNLGDRFGRFGGVPPKTRGVPRIWLHAVSVGEMLAAAPLLAPLRRETGAEVFLTTTTTTGFALAQERWRDAVIGIHFFPIDFWPWSARAWRTVAPDLVLLMEGERWPEHIQQAYQRGVPVLCVNARLSERGFRRARAVRGCALPLWRGVTGLLAGTESDAERFRQLGFDAARIETTGSIKLDVDIPRLAPAEMADLRRELGCGAAPIIVGASTWPGEEVALLALLRDARAVGAAARLVLVPRHVERRAELVALLAGSGFSYHLRSRGPCATDVDVVVGDTTGELRQFLQLADVVFIGRSLPPYAEGQTPVEAAILGRPMLFGPGMSNFRDIADGLINANGAIRVRDSEELSLRGVALLRDETARQALGAAASTWARSSRGAVLRTIAAIKKSMVTRTRT